MTLSETDYHNIADALLDSWLEALDLQLGDVLDDIELRNGILRIVLEDGREFVLNKHAPTRQLWLASPVSGARHFAWQGEAWRDSRQGDELVAVIVDELAQCGLSATLEAIYAL